MERFETPLNDYVRKGGHVLGICGGYQMLGQWVKDPNGLEGSPGQTRGLGLLPVQTLLQSPKTTTLSEFRWGDAYGRGYEIHMGATQLTGGVPFIRIVSRNGIPVNETDGCLADNGQVAGTYVHGFFDFNTIIKKWFDLIGLDHPLDFSIDAAIEKDKDYDHLKKHMETYLDLEALI
jgi:adenosylcobyric acid synthase